MSFFGFDAVLPERRDRPDDSLEDDAFGGRGGAEEEDLAVYTWGEDDYDGLGDQLIEAGDDLNDDTFGAFEGEAKVGRDFDFFGNTAKLDERQPAPKASKATAPSPPAQVPQGRLHQDALSRPSAEDLWKKQSSLQYPPSISSPASNSYSPFDQPIPGTSAVSQQQKRGKTLEDIEAEMLASASRPKPRTMEEIEAEMLMGGGGRPGPPPGFPQHQHQQHQQLPPHMQHQVFPHEQQQQGLPMGHQSSSFLSNLAPQGYPQQQQHGGVMGGFPPLSGQQMPQLPPHLQQVQHQTPQQMHQQLQLLQQQAQIPSQQLQQMQHQILQQQQQQQKQPAHPQQQQQQQAQPQQPPQPQQQQQPPQPQASAFNLAEMFPALPGQTIAANPSTELMGALVGLNAEQQAEVKHELERKIKEQERADEKRMRKARKIASMATYNDIMTRSDKDFITRIQVSQLVTQDPYADDFYAQVYGAIIRSKLGAPNGSSSVIRLSKDGSGVGVGMPGQKGAGRKEGAMHKMALQVKRIVDAAKQRERAPADAHLEGVLGKVTVRTSKTAPRPMLSTQGSKLSSPAVPKLDGKAPHMHATRGEPLTRRQTLIVLEELYGIVLKLEQLRRDSPPFQLIADQGSDEEKKLAEDWQEDYKTTSAKLWTRLAIDEPVDISDPHPFISLLTPTKGKRLFPRLLRHLSSAQVLTVFTLILACFSQVDVVRYAPHPVPPHSKDDEAKEKETDLFLGAIIPAFLSVLDRCELKIVAGMLGLIVSRCDVPRMSRTRPGIVLLTVLLSRAELLKQGTSEQPADPADLAQWERAFELLFQRLAPILPTLFPSSTLPPAFGPSLYAQKTPGGVDALDMPVWQMLSSMALHANMQQQQTLVGELRDKVLEGVVASKQRWVDEETARRKIANVDLLLHALGLDSGMIAA